MYSQRTSTFRADGNGWTALHYAAFGGKDTLTALNMLIDLGAELDVQNRNGEAAVVLCLALIQCECCLPPGRL